MKLYNRVILLALLLAYFPLFSQDVGEPEMQQVKSTQWDLSLFVHTSGGGIGYRYGKTPDHFNKHLLEINFLLHFDYKSVRGRNNYFPYSRPFSYGKLYDLAFFRTGYSYQRILSHKPYWGGVEFSYFFNGGFSLGIGLPTYLEIAYFSASGNYITKIERYDPEVHTLGNIVGGASFFDRFHKIAIRPGFYAKTGVNFDFTKNNNNIQMLEVGFAIDMIFPPLQIMAFNERNPFYLSAYIAYHFGRKKGIYD